jgi:hypothetical protein
MTRVCLVGTDDVNLQYELLSRETAREALSTYDIHEPFENALGVETVSLGAAVALLNDLDWYLVRFVDEAMVLEPSIADDEWLSRDLATAVRDDEVTPEQTDRFLKVYGLEGATGSEASSATEETTAAETTTDGEGDQPNPATESAGPTHYRLVEPMYVTRTGSDIPDYDLRDVEGTLVERVTESEFGA